MGGREGTGGEVLEEEVGREEGEGGVEGLEVGRVLQELAQRRLRGQRLRHPAHVPPARVPMGCRHLPKNTHSD